MVKVSTKAIIKTIRNGALYGSIRIKESKIIRLCVASALLSSLVHTAYAVDYLAASKPDVENTFGASSTFKTYLYLAEIVFATITYIKTKNLLALGGVVILAVFLNFALTAFAT